MKYVKLLISLLVAFVAVGCGDVNIPEKIEIEGSVKDNDAGSSGSSSDEEESNDLNKCENTPLRGKWYSYKNYDWKNFYMTFKSDCTLSMPKCGDYTYEISEATEDSGIVTYEVTEAANDKHCPLVGKHECRFSFNHENEINWICDDNRESDVFYYLN